MKWMVPCTVVSSVVKIGAGQPGLQRSAIAMGDAHAFDGNDRTFAIAGVAAMVSGAA